MRFAGLLLVTALVIAGALGQPSFVHGRALAPADDPGRVVSAGETTGDEDDDTVNVQLVVLAAVGGAVFLLLPLGYVLRRRLGLTAYTPPADAH